MQNATRLGSYFTATALLAAALLMLTSSSNTQAKPESDTQPKQVLRHVVLFKFKKSASKKQIQKVVQAFAALPKKIDTIIDFEMGTDVSVENKSKGFTHGFVVTFRNEKGRAKYLPHPEHQKFVKLVGPLLEDVLVFDYKTTR